MIDKTDVCVLPGLDKPLSTAACPFRRSPFLLHFSIVGPFAMHAQETRLPSKRHIPRLRPLAVTAALLFTPFVQAEDALIGLGNSLFQDEGASTRLWWTWESPRVSANGTVVSGTASPVDTNLTRAFRWSAGTMQNLGTLGGNRCESTGISADGSVVVGRSTLLADDNDVNYHAFRWLAGKMSDLGTLGGSQSHAVAVSADGQVIVGNSTIAAGTASHAFRWTGGGM